MGCSSRQFASFGGFSDCSGSPGRSRAALPISSAFAIAFTGVGFAAAGIASGADLVVGPAVLGFADGLRSVFACWHSRCQSSAHHGHPCLEEYTSARSHRLGSIFATLQPATAEGSAPTFERCVCQDFSILLNFPY